MYLTELQINYLLRLLTEADKAISGAVAFDPIMRAQSSIFFSLGIRNQDLMKSGFQMLDKLSAEFKSSLGDLYARYSAGNLDYSGALSQWKSLTGKYYQEMFRAGAMSSGNPYYRDSGLTKRDLSFVNSARRAEQKFFSQFLVDIKDPNFKPVHPFAQRAGYYADSAKAQWMNGLLAGAGDNISIDWILGATDNHCHSCVALAAGGPYTWQTLPTTPRSGDTECLMNCKCSLNIKRSNDAAAAGPLAGPGAVGRRLDVSVMNDLGDEITGAMRSSVEDLYAQMYKARQMIYLEDNPLLKKDWIVTRKGLNQSLIDIAKSQKLKVRPGIAVSELLDAADDAKKFGGVIGADVVVGDEAVLLRGNQVIKGIVRGVDSFYGGGVKITLTTLKGNYIYDVSTDIIFKLDGMMTRSGENARRAFAVLLDKDPDILAKIENSSAERERLLSEYLHSSLDNRQRVLFGDWFGNRVTGRALAKHAAKAAFALDTMPYQQASTQPIAVSASYDQLAKEWIEDSHKWSSPAVNATKAQVDRVKKSLESAMVQMRAATSEYLARKYPGARTLTLWRMVSQEELDRIIKAGNALDNTLNGFTWDMSQFEMHRVGFHMLECEIPIEDIVACPAVHLSPFRTEQEFLVLGTKNVRLKKFSTFIGATQKLVWKTI